MGGKALSKPSVRLLSDRYFEVEERVVEQLREVVPEGVRVAAVEAYRCKPSFGDLDVLVERYDGFDPFALAEALNATEVVRNGDVTSVGVEVDEGVFQVDLIKAQPESFEFNFRYFSFNDMGNLLGRVAKRMGFKFGHNGFRYLVRHPKRDDCKLGEVTLTLSFEEALNFLGYDGARYMALAADKEKGFRALDDVFAYVYRNPYLHPGMFALEEQNHHARVRDRKRPVYRAFLDYLEAMPEPEGGYFDWSEKAVLRQHHLERAFEAFPHFKVEYERLVEQAALDDLVKMKFNGRVAGEVTGLKGKELGQFMQSFKAFHGDKFRRTMLMDSPEAVRKRMVDFWKQVSELPNAQ